MFPVLQSPKLNRLFAALSERRVIIILLCLTAAVLVISFLTLTSYPKIFIDEPWDSDVAWNLLKTGVNFDRMHAGVLDRWDAYWVRWTLLASLPYSASFGLLGLGLFQGRVVSWLFGLVLLGFTFGVGKRLYSPLTGALAALLVALSLSFLQASHYIRPEVMLAAANMTALYCYLAGAQDGRRWTFAVAGLIGVLAVDIHINGAFFLLALGVLHLVRVGREFFRSSSTWLLAAGAAVGAIYYLIVRVLPNPQTFFHCLTGCQGNILAPPIAQLNPLVWLRSLVGELGRYNFLENGLDLALIGAAVIFLLLRFGRSDRLLFAYLAATFVLFVLLVAHKGALYAVLFYPLLLLCIAEAFVDALRRCRELPAVKLFLTLLLALALVNGGVQYTRPLIASRGYDYYAVTRQIGEVVPSGARVLGMPQWWLGLADREYRSSLTLTYLHFLDGLSLTEGMERLRPDYLILDGAGLAALLVDEGYFAAGEGFAGYRLPRAEFWAFIQARGELLLKFEDPFEGPFEVYAIRW